MPPEQLAVPKPPKQSSSWVPKLIAVFYVAEIILHIVSGTLGATLTCLGSCNELTPVYQQEVWLMCGLFVLAIIEAVGLFKRQLWAKTFGIVLGVLLLAPSIFAFYTTGTSLLMSLVFIFINPLDIVNILAISYLIWPKQNTNWVRNDKYVDGIIVFILSVLGMWLVVVNIQNYHAVVKPFRDTLQAEDQAKIQDVVKAGTVYTDPEYGFQLTFPNDRTVSKSEYTMAATTHVQTSIEFSGKNFLGGNLADTFYVDVSDIFPGEETLDSIISQGLKYEPRDSWSKGEFNGIPYAKDSDWIGPDRSFQYVILHNGKVFKFADRGGMSASQFDPIMQTLKFAN